MHAAKGILTARGGMTSHAAVVARGMGKPCVVGAGDAARSTTTARALQRRRHRSSRPATSSRIDGATGEVMHRRGRRRSSRELSGDFATLMDWADEIRRLKVRTNADTPHDAGTARKFGAEGIGLCRTEHMFFDADAHRRTCAQMILADDRDGPPRGARQARCPMQREDFVGIFRGDGRAAGHHPPARSAAARVPAARRRGDGRGRQGRSASTSPKRAAPRGAAARSPTRCSATAAAASASPIPRSPRCRSRAIIEAAVEVQEEGHQASLPEIMIPLVGTRRGARRSSSDHGRQGRRGGHRPSSGAQDRVPGRHDDRAAARRAAPPTRSPRTAEFFSFGTNDLTQMTFGLRRDDAGKLPAATTSRRTSSTDDPFVSHRHRRRRRADEDGRRAGPRDAARPEGRHLRRARRRPGPRSSSATRSGWTTSPARRSACRSPGWRRRRRH